LPDASWTDCRVLAAALLRCLKNTETERVSEGHQKNESFSKQRGHSRIGGKSPYGDDMRQFRRHFCPDGNSARHSRDRPLDFLSLFFPRARKENGRLYVSALRRARSKHSASIPGNAFPSSSEIRARLTLRAASPTGSRLLSLYFKLIMRLYVFLYLLYLLFYQDVGDVLLDNRNAKNRNIVITGPKGRSLKLPHVSLSKSRSVAKVDNKENFPMRRLEIAQSCQE